MSINQMVSLRIPSSLLEELKDLSKREHFMDTSEAARSILRESWLKSRDPHAHELQKIRKEITDSLSKRSHEDIINELEKIRDSIINKND